MDACFKNFIDFFPPTENLIKPTSEIIKKYNNLLPQNLLNFWKEYGFGNYGGGLIKVINPLDYADVEGVNNAVDIPLLADSFGDIFIYRTIPEKEMKAVGILNIHYRNREFFITDEDCIEQLFDGIDPAMPMMRTELFKEAVEKNGELAFNEIFFFAPALALGGGENIKCVEKGNAFVHYSLLAQLLGTKFDAQY